MTVVRNVREAESTAVMTVVSSGDAPPVDDCAKVRVLSTGREAESRAVTTIVGPTFSADDGASVSVVRTGRPAESTAVKTVVDAEAASSVDGASVRVISTVREAESRAVMIVARAGDASPVGRNDPGAGVTVKVTTVGCDAEPGAVITVTKAEGFSVP